MIDRATEALLARYRRMRVEALARSARRYEGFDREPFDAERDRRDEALEWPVKP